MWGAKAERRKQEVAQERAEEERRQLEQQRTAAAKAQQEADTLADRIAMCEEAGMVYQARVLKAICEGYEETSIDGALRRFIPGFYNSGWLSDNYLDIHTSPGYVSHLWRVLPLSQYGTQMPSVAISAIAEAMRSKAFDDILIAAPASHFNKSGAHTSIDPIAFGVIYPEGSESLGKPHALFLILNWA